MKKYVLMGLLLVFPACANDPEVPPNLRGHAPSAGQMKSDAYWDSVLGFPPVADPVADRGKVMLCSGKDEETQEIAQKFKIKQEGQKVYVMVFIRASKPVKDIKVQEVKPKPAEKEKRQVEAEQKEPQEEQWFIIRQSEDDEKVYAAVAEKEKLPPKVSITVTVTTSEGQRKQITVTIPEEYLKDK